VLRPFLFLETRLQTGLTATAATGTATGCKTTLKRKGKFHEFRIGVHLHTGAGGGGRHH